MTSTANRSLDATPLDETIEAPSADSLPGSQPRCPRVALVEGSGPQLKSVTAALLRSRLRASALVLFFGFFLFLIRPYFSEPGRLAASVPYLDAFHIVVIFVLAGYGTMLCTNCNVSLPKLRLAELLIFGLPGAFFVYMTHVGLQLCIERGDAIGIVAISNRGLIFALMLMFVYTLFIPNTWRRASGVISVMALAPILVVGMAAQGHELVGQALTLDGYIAMVLTMVIAGSTMTYGTHTINTLRRDAFEARQLGQYRLRQRLGGGGMGDVYLAEHQLLKRPCAIKVIHPHHARDPKAMARFEREVQATAQLTHWNTVEIFDYGHTEDGTFYYVMEYLPGQSLAELVERHGPLAPERVVYLLEQTCRALHEAHAAGLVHRDIKPGNIFAAQRGGVYDVVKLLDFGLVKPVFESETSEHLTQEGTITGSPLYMSPEQALGDDDADARSDIYSLGAVAYFLLTGRPPFTGTKPLQILFAHAHEQATPPSQWRPDLPTPLEAIVMRCLAKKREERYQTVDCLAAALAECPLPGGWTPERAAQWWREADAGRPALEPAQV